MYAVRARARVALRARINKTVKLLYLYASSELKVNNGLPVVLDPNVLNGLLK